LVKEALSRVAGDEQRRRDLLLQPVARLAIGLDQLEEIFTLSERFSPDGRVSFFKGVRALVESGYGWVAATLRSDFFSRCEEIAELVELKQGNGQYHLLPPSGAQLSQAIRYPAEKAGVVGALRKRAEDAFRRLEPSEREALGPVLHQLMRLGSGGDETLTRRIAIYETAMAQPGAKGLVDAFITARLSIADLDSRGDRSLTVAHEALFRVWPEISRWEKENRDFLRVRARLGEAMARWIECNRQSDYLLAPGRPLAEAEDLLKYHDASLEQQEKSYILASRQKVDRGLRRRWLIVASVIALLAAVAGVAVWEWRAAVRSANRAVSARSSAEGILNYLLNQLSEKLKPIGHLDIVEDVQKQVETYYKNLGFGQEDTAAANNWATLLKAEGDRLMAQGDLTGAKSKYQQSLDIVQNLAKQAPTDTNWQRNLAVGYNRLGLVLAAQGDLNAARAHYHNGLEVILRLAKQDPGNSGWQFDLADSDRKIGDVLTEQGDLQGAKAQYQSALEILQKLVKLDPTNGYWQQDLSTSYEKIGDVLKAEGDLDGARNQYQSALETSQKLTKQEPGNTDGQYRMSHFYRDLGVLLKQQGDIRGARQNLQASLDLLTSLIRLHGENVTWKRDLDFVKKELAE
jgi:tetratricopeptide (TPR) repeat protein